jgi:16S rRNA (adenine1518-N6/adenine1519-N6)-dimethyltransferase
MPSFDNSTKLLFRPQKKLGQNFLSSNEYLKKIVSACLINNNTRILEIGPGYGSLTKLLSKTNCKSLTSIEKDPNLFKWLSSPNSGDWSDKIEFFLGDALEIEWDKFIKENISLSDDDEVIIVGNLPYYISNILIGKLLEKKHLFKRLVFLVQKEVAQRWVATPFKYKNKYSNLSIFINYSCNSELLFEIPKKFFKPVPEVDGGLVVLEINSLSSKHILDEDKFFLFVRNCFKFRRKTLFNNIKSFWGNENEIKEIFKSLEYDEKIRPQDLSLEDFLKLFNSFKVKKNN